MIRNASSRENLDTVDELSHSSIRSRAFELAAETMKANPEVAAILQERYIAPVHDLDALLQYPQDSLGYAYASSLKQQGFDRIDPEVKIDADTSYIEYRWQHHDMRNYPNYSKPSNEGGKWVCLQNPLWLKSGKRLGKNLYRSGDTN